MEMSLNFNGREFDSFSAWLKFMLATKRMSQRELAEKTGLTAHTINRYLGEGWWPTLYSFNRMTEALGLKMVLVEKNEIHQAS